MQENRSFDHYFGSLRGVRGFDDHPAGDPGVFAQPWAGSSAGPPLGHVLPFHLDTVAASGECTADLSHEWPAQHGCWAGGRMDGFVRTHTLAENEGAANGFLTMGYYTRSDLPLYYALADAFTVCDGYHCSVLGPSDPNRLYSMSASIDLAGVSGGPVITNLSPPLDKFRLSWATMPERLEAKGVSWKVYNPTGSQYQPDNPLAAQVSNNKLLFFRQYADRNSALYNKAFVPLYTPDFATDVAKGALPQVSWVISQSVPMDEDEHPPAPPTRGEWFTHQVLSTLISNPQVWAKTVLFVSHDENDGFFDHVAPPTAPEGTPEEYQSAPLPAATRGIAGPVGLGFRVPMLVVSPFSRGGYVCSEPFDHTSQLRFLETRFGVEVPNLSAWRRSVTGDLTSALHSASPDVSVPPLPAPQLDDARIARECQPNQLNGIDVPGPSYSLPVGQRMPAQEPGAARRLPRP
jgi:phospholipase C